MKLSQDMTARLETLCAAFLRNVEHHSRRERTEEIISEMAYLFEQARQGGSLPALSVSVQDATKAEDKVR